MRVFCLKMAVFLLGFICVVKLVGSFDHRDRNDHNVLRIHSANQYDNLDILFVGNSFVNTGVNPEVFERNALKTFSLGVDSAGVDFYDALTDNYFRNTQIPPKRVLFLVSAMTFSHFADNFGSARIHRFFSPPVSNEELTLNYDVPYFLLIRKSFAKGLQGFWANSKKAGLPKRLRETRGFRPGDLTFNPILFAETKETYLPLNKNLFPKGDVAALLRLAEKTQERGAQVMFFELPTFKSRSFFSDAYLREYAAALTRLEQAGFPVIHNKLDLGPESFRNMDHLNTSGAELASRSLVATLSQISP